MLADALQIENYKVLSEGVIIVDDGDDWEEDDGEYDWEA